LICFPLLFLPIGITFFLNTILFKSNHWQVFYLCYTFAGLSTLVVSILILKKWNFSIKDIGVNKFEWSHVGWGALFFCIACIWCTGIALILKYGFGLSKDWLLAISFDRPYHPLIMLLSMVIVGPVTEEVLFRGFFLTFTKDKIKIWGAGILSSILFGLYYYYLTGLAGALLILFWAPLPIILFTWKKSLYPSIALHMINNLFPYVVLKFFVDLPIVHNLTNIGIL
jgi:membrane protease YdiL (CAAX protease family)